MVRLSEQQETCQINVPVDQAFKEPIQKAIEQGDPEFTETKPTSYRDVLNMLSVNVGENDEAKLETISRYLQAIKSIQTDDKAKLDKLMAGLEALLSEKEKTPEQKATKNVNDIWKELHLTTGVEVKKEFFSVLVDLYHQRKQMKKASEHPEKHIALALRKSGLIHNRTIKQHLKDGVFDLDSFAETISQRPTELLKKNEKMSKSKEMIIYDTTMPAYEGLYYNQKEKKFYLKRTCPSAGECTFDCYARKGNAATMSDVSLNRIKTLTFYMNNPDGFKKQMLIEIEQKKAENPGVQVYVRWHESGDFWDERYLVFAFSIAEATPDIQHYAYTKQVYLVNKYKEMMPQNFLFNFSFGGKQDQKLSINVDKNSVILPSKAEDGSSIFRGLAIKLLDDGKTEEDVRKVVKRKKSLDSTQRQELVSRIMKTRQLLNKQEGMKKTEWDKIVSANVRSYTKSLEFNNNAWNNYVAEFIKRTFTVESIKLLKQRALDYLTKKHGMEATIDQIITFDELLGIHGFQKVPPKSEPYYHVLVWGVHGDNAATRKDVISSILLVH